MSAQATGWALATKTGDPTRKVILLVLADQARPDGTRAFPSIKTIAEAAEVSTRTVIRHLQALEADGLIRRGDQRYVDYLPADKRPVVYDLLMRGDNLSRRPLRGDTGDPSGVTPVTERGDTGVTQPQREDPSTDDPTPPEGVGDGFTDEVKELTRLLLDRYGEWSQSEHPIKMSREALKDMDLLLRRGPTEWETPEAISAERVRAAIEVIFTCFAQPDRSGFCWAKNVQSPGALRKHWVAIRSANKQRLARRSTPGVPSATVTYDAPSIRYG